MIILIDNYDSFTYNLVHYLGDVLAKKDWAGANRPDIRVIRNDAMSAKEVLALEPDAIVLSPGPCDPDRAGICLDLITEADGTVPLLGVCLGHQAIGQACGGQVVRADAIMHGKISEIRTSGDGLFAELPEHLTVTRYHSLTLAPESLPDCLEVTASTEDGTIMGIQHKTDPVFGVQFHPESIASEHGHAMLANFLKAAEVI
ncbi:MAG: aminodeoxychorismate/anthranilate synthase component II [Pseudomonadota bacterium]